MTDQPKPLSDRIEVCGPTDARSWLPDIRALERQLAALREALEPCLPYVLAVATQLPEADKNEAIRIYKKAESILRRKAAGG